jgi:cellulose synthase/poly-beta-1,6-N-acetylglucosamine synthase-like glycosyltransferase
MITYLNLSNHAFFYYYLVCNFAYLFMLITALHTSAVYQQKLRSVRFGLIKDSPLVPPVTMVVPAHNEEKTISLSVRNLLDLDYPELEIVIVNDGSSDDTLEVLRQEFHLRPVTAVYVQEVASAPVRQLYRSDFDPRLLIIDKESLGARQMRSTPG